MHRWISAQEMGNGLHDVNNRLKGEFADFHTCCGGRVIHRAENCGSGGALSSLRK